MPQSYHPLPNAVVEFVGKSTISRLSAAVFKNHPRVREPTRRVDDRSGPHRVLSKGRFAAEHTLGCPQAALSTARNIFKTDQASTTDRVRVSFNLQYVAGVVVRARSKYGVALLDQGPYQGVWSVGLRSTADWNTLFDRFEYFLSPPALDLVGPYLARERIRAAVELLRGGPDGCRQLAAWADDGYAHPDAHHILTGIITPTDDDSNGDAVEATRINTSSWAFDPSADEGSVMDVVSTAGNATTIVDRNDHGARLHTPPSRVAGNGEKAPRVGLDATGRAELWRVVLGEEVQTTDIFDSERDRRQFLEDTLDLRVIQTADRPRYYEGDPATKDTDGDAALLQAIAEKYSGIQAPRQRGEEPERFGKPAAITTKRIREVLESDPRLDGVVDTWDNYGNVTGENELGEHRLAAILGCQYFGDDNIEKFAALAGEEVDTDHLTGRGSDLDYDSDVANACLKHMTEDQTMQAILRFARGEDGGATVVETWSDTATNIVEKARSLGGEFTSADVRPAVDVKSRQVRRVLGELVDARYLQRTEGGPGVAHEYEQMGDPGAGEVSIPDRDEAVPDTDPPGHSSSNTYYIRNVRVFTGDRGREDDLTRIPAPTARAPPAPGTIEVSEPPD